MGAREEFAPSTVAIAGAAFEGAAKLASNKPVAEQNISPLKAMFLLLYRRARRLKQPLTAEISSTDGALHCEGISRRPAAAPAWPVVGRPRCQETWTTRAASLLPLYEQMAGTRRLNGRSVFLRAFTHISARPDIAPAASAWPCWSYRLNYRAADDCNENA